MIRTALFFLYGALRVAHLASSLWTASCCAHPGWFQELTCSVVLYCYISSKIVAGTSIVCWEPNYAYILAGMIAVMP